MNASVARLVDLLLPGRCLHCGRRIGSPVPSSYLCERCAAQLRAGVRVDAGVPVVAALLLQGPARTLIHQLKYRGHTGIADELAVHMAPWVVRLQLPGCWLVPVPLHRLRRWHRGYDQAALLATAIARQVPEAATLPALRRRRRTAPQVGLDGGARRRNLAGAFRIGVGQRLLRRWPCVLVDDVVTTGTTLREAARVLRLHGGKPIAAVAAATPVGNAPATGSSRQPFS